MYHQSIVLVTFAVKLLLQEKESISKSQVDQVSTGPQGLNQNEPECTPTIVNRFVEWVSAINGEHFFVCWKVYPIWELIGTLPWKVESWMRWFSRSWWVHHMARNLSTCMMRIRYSELAFRTCFPHSKAQRKDDAISVHCTGRPNLRNGNIRRVAPVKETYLSGILMILFSGTLFFERKWKWKKACATYTQRCNA